MVEQPGTGKGLVLVVEDERPIADLVRMYLTREGFGVAVEQDGAAGLAAARKLRPVACVLDIRVPGMDGTEICRRLRESGDWTPVIFLTARDDEVDRILGLELGADDYITKPFATRELVARVKAVLRRFERPTSPSIIRFEEVVIDANAMQLTVRGTLTTTTATEFRLLDYLARHPGRVYSRDHLLDAVWGDARFVTPRSVDVYVRRIREKIEIDP